PPKRSAFPTSWAISRAGPRGCRPPSVPGGAPPRRGSRQLGRGGPVVVLGGQPGLADAADGAIVAEALAAVDLRIHHKPPAPQAIDQLGYVRLQRRLHLLPFLEGDRLVSLLAQRPVADVVEREPVPGQDDPLDGHGIERELEQAGLA